MIRDFVAVIKHDGQAYYALFTFEDTGDTIEAYAQYVRTWPEHNQLDDDSATDLLDSTLDQFIPHMQAHLQGSVK